MTSEAAICPGVPRSADFINPFSQYQNSQCEKAVMNLTGFFLCKTIRAQLADCSDKKTLIAAESAPLFTVVCELQESVRPVSRRIHTFLISELHHEKHSVLIL